MENKKNYILIVDDLPDNIKLLGNILKTKNYIIEAASSGTQALAMVNKKRPDLVLLDVMMPGMNGFEVAKTLKKDRTTRDIPIIFLTAKVEKEDIIYGFEVGAADYVTKPFNPSELLARVNTQLDLKKSRDIILEQNLEQKELLHILCHDLSAPFNSMISMLSMADLLDNLDQIKDIISKIKDASTHGLGIIELVRNMYALEEGKIELGICNLKKSLDLSCFMLKDTMSQKKISLNNTVDSKFYVIAEHVSLVTSVLNNLLTNAIKFSYPESSIDISSEEKGETVLLSIKDRGIGIPEDMLAVLFNMSNTMHRTGTEGEPGTGYGMPLVNKFITMYGGTIKIISNAEKEGSENHGTEVVITFKASLKENSR